MTGPTERCCSLGLDLSGITLACHGLSARVRDRFHERWAPFAGEVPDGPFLRVVLEIDDEPAPEGEFEPKRMQSELSPRRALYTMPEGRATVDDSGLARLRLHDGLGEREYYTTVNLLRACLAWVLPARGGALLHAAALVVDGAGFLLVGAEGSGKSTWTEQGLRGGAHAISDDLILIDGVGPRPELLGAPFTSSVRTAPGRGRWPVAGILFPEHGSPPTLAPVSTIQAKAKLAANLPFLAEGLEHDVRIPALLDRWLNDIPCRRLTFSPDPSFLDLLRSPGP